MRALAGTQKRQWNIIKANGEAASLARALGVSPLIAQLLINRGLTDKHAGATFLKPKLTDLIEPELMPGVPEAIERISSAIRNGEKITVYGDYDVDGITAVSILWQVLTKVGAKVDYYIPHRLEEGYGLNVEAIAELAKAGTKLLVTVDCGICARKAAEFAAEKGVDLVITDHHQPNGPIPKAAAIVHPSLDDSYGNPRSAGAVVAFKLAWAIANKFNAGDRLSSELRQFMLNATMFAAMGTVADVMSLTGENRVITSYGLKALPESDLHGIQALIESAGLAGQKVGTFEVGFRLAPVLNAAGRMGHARLAVELLTADNQMRAMKIAQYLKDQNRLRQKCEKDIFKQVRDAISHARLDHPDRKTIVLAGEGWHGGVLGIVASRVIDKLYRPTILLSITDGIAQGSARSIAGFDILGGISACSEHLEDYGGHKMAAGVTLKVEKMGDFANAFESYAQKNLKECDMVDRLNIDAAAEIREFSTDMVNQLSLLGPFGEGNSEPLFASRGVKLIASPRRVGAGGDHLQISITDGTASMRCIGFRMGKLEKKLQENEFFNIAYKANLNTFNGATNVQFVLEDVQFE